MNCRNISEPIANKILYPIEHDEALTIVRASLFFHIRFLNLNRIVYFLITCAIVLPISAGLCNHVNTTFFHDLHFSSSRIFCTANNSTGMTHAAAGRRCLAGNKTNNRFFIAAVLNLTGSFGFHAATNFTNHYNGIGFGIVHKQFHRFFSSCANNRVATNTYSG